MKGPEKGLRYKTARISYLLNYFLIILLSALFLIILPYLDFQALWSQLVILLIFGLAIVLLLEPEVERALREYFITDSEVIKVEGIIRKKKISIPYQSVADVRVVKGIIGRIFDFGNVTIKGIKDDIIMKGMKAPEQIGKLVEERIYKLKGAKLKVKE